MKYNAIQTKYNAPYKQNTIAPHKCCIPLTVGGAKSALVRGLAEKFCTQERFCLPQTSSYRLQTSAAKILTTRFICTEKSFWVLKLSHLFFLLLGYLNFSFAQVADTDTPQHNGTFYPLLLIGTIKGQSVEQAIKLGIELDRPMAALSFGHNSPFIAQGTHWK